MMKMVLEEINKPTGYIWFDFFIGIANKTNEIIKFLGCKCN